MVSYDRLFPAVKKPPKTGIWQRQGQDMKQNIRTESTDIFLVSLVLALDKYSPIGLHIYTLLLNCVNYFFLDLVRYAFINNTYSKHIATYKLNMKT